MLYPGVTVFISIIRNGAGPSEKVGVIGIGAMVSVIPLFVSLRSGPFPV
jgi:D-arabinose 1-dehydrogenase-like Zn-dependent alcohol dehydrogenase